MTTLDLVGGDRRADNGLASKIKWSVIVPWAVSVLMVGTQGYHRFISVEEARAADVSSMKSLGDKVDDQRREIGDLKEEVAVLKAVVLRMEAQMQRDRRR